MESAILLFSVLLGAIKIAFKSRFMSFLNALIDRFINIRSSQVVILKARPAMDAAVMSFHLSLSPTNS